MPTGVVAGSEAAHLSSLWVRCSRSVATMPEGVSASTAMRSGRASTMKGCSRRAMAVGLLEGDSWQQERMKSWASGDRWAGTGGGVFADPILKMALCCEWKWGVGGG